MSIMKFSGGISYEGISSGGSGVRRFYLIDENTVLLDLISKPYDEKQSDTRFLGIAEKQGDGNFVTPWIYLMNERGGVHLEGSAMISFYITHNDGYTIRIMGKWIAEDDSIYKFDCNLPRDFEAENK